MIGDERITKFSERVIKKNVLRLLTPTDCIKDRLAAYIHWNDKQSLEQAVMVAKAQDFNLSSVKKFCSNEGNERAFVEFIEKFKL